MSARTGVTPTATIAWHSGRSRGRSVAAVGDEIAHPLGISLRDERVERAWGQAGAQLAKEGIEVRLYAKVTRVEAMDLLATGHGPTCRPRSGRRSNSRRGGTEVDVIEWPLLFDDMASAT
ncbi:MAG: hypothetical protein M0Z95_05090 [Actinomycetota bacterium]|nr:hypothetical protein [Actinomycetota bacterium]